MEDHLINAMANKRPVPEIDFTLHTMDDGTQVNTQERVCKGTLLIVDNIEEITDAFQMCRRLLSILLQTNNSTLMQNARNQTSNS